MVTWPIVFSFRTFSTWWEWFRTNFPIQTFFLEMSCGEPLSSFLLRMCSLRQKLKENSSKYKTILFRENGPCAFDHSWYNCNFVFKINSYLFVLRHHCALVKSSLHDVNYCCKINTNLGRNFVIYICKINLLIKVRE